MIKRIGSSLACAFIALFAAAVGFFFHRYSFQGLSVEALNCAQIARNIAQGHGFSTSIVSTSQLSQANVPEMFHAPLFPFLLGWAFTFAGGRDSVVTGLSLTLYIVSAVALFVLAKRLLHRGGWATVIAIAFSLSLPVLVVADAGLPQALSACLLLLLLLILTPKITLEAPLPDAPLPPDSPLTDAPQTRVTKQTEITKQAELTKQDPTSILLADDATEIESLPDDLPPPPPDRLLSRYFAAGLLAALCYLSDYVSLFYVVPLALFWGEGLLGWRWRRVAVFLVGFALVAAPWWIRNMRLIGNPLYSVPWLILSGKTNSVSGFWSYLQQQGITFFYGMTNAPHLYLMPFIVLSLWLRPQQEVVARCKTATWVALIITLLGFSIFNRDTPAALVPLASLLTLLGFTTFFQIISNAAFFEAVVERLLPSLDFEQTLEDPMVYRAIVRQEAIHPSIKRIRLHLLAFFRLPLVLRVSPEAEVLYCGRWPFARLLEAQSTALLFIVLSLPVAWQLSQLRPPAPPDLKVALQPLVKAVPQDRIIVTDSPQVVAWYSERKTTPLPQNVAQLLSLNDQPTLGAVYLSGQRLGSGYEEWAALYGPVNLPGYQKLTETSSQNALYVKQPDAQEARRLVQKQPKNGAAYLALGQALLQSQQFQNALTAFATAQRLQPNSQEAAIGAGTAYFGLGNLTAAQSQLAQVLRRAPRSLPGMMGMAEVLQAQGEKAQAISLYERVLSDSPNYPLALNNVAQLYADQNQNLYRALELARRAVAQNPNNSSMIATLASVCLRLGYRQEAVQYLQQAAKLSPNDQEFRQRLEQAQRNSV